MEHKTTTASNESSPSYSNDNLPTAQLIGFTDQPYDNAAVLSAQVYEDAVPIPNNDNNITAHAPERDRAAASLAGYRGRMQAEQELEALRRAGQDVGAQQYFQNTAVTEGNRAARNIAAAEEYSVRNPRSDVPVKKDVVPERPRLAPEFYEGTYGKEYEVSPYDCGEYDTKDYEVSEYKSVYEK